MLLAAGCRPETKDKLLRVFFTGVDAKGRPAVAAAAVSTNTAVRTAATNTFPVVFLHQPFAERNCTACHVSDLSQELRTGGSGLCLGCHDKLIGNAKYVHAPVSDGRCDLCHQSHDSPERFLLTRKAQVLCLDCHALVQMAKLRDHATLPDAGCTSCHDPHRSERKSLVKPAP
ncbi:MAG: cytochrome c3 family protein [Verrucomicrobiota bacterium]|jgi:predicted CXXCH cytochrome family protein